MTKDEIIAMAKEANPENDLNSMLQFLQRFAALVAAKEREACAQVCSGRAMYCEAEAQRAIENGEHDVVSAIRSTAWQISVCAAAIRARGKA